MPVAVPRNTTTHARLKPTQPGPVDRPSVFQHLSYNLPHPRGQQPPRAANTNRADELGRYKPFRLWEDDLVENRENIAAESDLSFASDWLSSKAALAEAGMPPFPRAHSLNLAPIVHRPSVPLSTSAADEDDEDSMDDEYFGGDHGHPEEDVWASPDHPEMEIETDDDCCEDDMHPLYDPAHPAYVGDDRLDSGHGQSFVPSFDPSPVLDDGLGPDSSPVGPLTPFGEFVDRAVATADIPPRLQEAHWSGHQPAAYLCLDSCCSGNAPRDAYLDDRKIVPSAPIELNPLSNPKKIVDHLADWVATYVWKVCTTGMGLPLHFALPSSQPKPFSSLPPSHLCNSVRSLLLSTLLQPSAVFLGLWYIVRMPVFFGPVGFGSEQPRETRFRRELLGDGLRSVERLAAETEAPFRLVLLGFMLANKWLDDHTFSNKTWHTISNVPIDSLNRLEFLALDMFAHDLSITPQQWSDWLGYLMSYHVSLASSPVHPQPIARPSHSPYSIMRKVLEELLHAPVVGDAVRCCDDETCTIRVAPSPVFLGIEERIKERIQQEEESTRVEEFDLDEDGPLRREYLPRRRVGRADSLRSTNSGDARLSGAWSNYSGTDRYLPPPAKWSPRADEPIRRAVRQAPPPILPPPPQLHGLLPPVPRPLTHYAPWPPIVYVPSQAPAYPYESASGAYVQHPYGYGGSDHGYNSGITRQERSGSASYGQCPYNEPLRVGYDCSELRMTAQCGAPAVAPSSHWPPADVGGRAQGCFQSDHAFSPVHWVRA